MENVEINETEEVREKPDIDDIPFDGSYNVDLIGEEILNAFVCR